MRSELFGVSLIALLGVILIAAIVYVGIVSAPSSGATPYQSPCVISWDENVDAARPSTFCILTDKAAALEKAHS